MAHLRFASSLIFSGLLGWSSFCVAEDPSPIFANEDVEAKPLDEYTPTSELPIEPIFAIPTKAPAALEPLGKPVQAHPEYSITPHVIVKPDISITELNAALNADTQIPDTTDTLPPSAAQERTAAIEDEPPSALRIEPLESTPFEELERLETAPIETLGDDESSPTVSSEEAELNKIIEEMTEDKAAPRVAALPKESTIPQQPIVEPVPVSPPQLDRNMIDLRNRVRHTLGYHFAHPENTADHTPWGVMHAMLSFGVDTRIYTSGRSMNAVGFLCWNYQTRGQQIFYLQNNKLKLRVGPGVQGHEGQLLAMLAQSKVSRDYPIQVNGRRFTVQDLVEYEKASCRSRTELTFKLIGLSHYLDSDATWVNDRGETWSIPKMISEELAQKIVGAACGGTHRMMGFAYSVNRRQQQGKPIDGQWKRAETYVHDYQRYLFSLQNSDGSFSTEWFEGRGNKQDVERKLLTTGHLLEWIVFSTPADELHDPRIVRSVRYLNNVLMMKRRQKWEVGPKGHALRALVLYDQKVFEGELGLGAGADIEKLWASNGGYRVR